MEIIERKFYSLNDHTRLIADNEMLSNVSTLEELKELMNDAYVGENDDMIVYHAFLRYTEQYDMEEDDDTGTETWEEFCVYVINKHNVTDHNWVVSSHIFNNIYIGKTVVVADSIPFLIEEDTKTFAYLIETIDFYGNEEVDKEIYAVLDEVKNAADLEYATSRINHIIDWADLEEFGAEIAIDMSIFTRGKTLTLDMVKDFTKYMDSFQEMKDWSDVTENNLNLENVLYKTIVILSEKGCSPDINLNRLVGTLEDILIHMNIDWDSVDDGKTTVEKEIINAMVRKTQEEERKRCKINL